MGSLKDDITLPLNMVSVISTIRRFHFRYHSNVAVLFYLFDLHVGFWSEFQRGGSYRRHCSSHSSVSQSSGRSDCIE